MQVIDHMHINSYPPASSSVFKGLEALLLLDEVPAVQRLKGDVGGYQRLNCSPPIGTTSRRCSSCFCLQFQVIQCPLSPKACPLDFLFLSSSEPLFAKPLRPTSSISSPLRHQSEDAIRPSTGSADHRSPRTHARLVPNAAKNTGCPLTRLDAIEIVNIALGTHGSIWR